MVNQLAQFSPLDAATYVQQQGEMGRQRGQQNKLAQLASQSYSAPADQQSQLLGQMAAIDPRAAQAQQQQFESAEDRRNKTLANMSNLLVNAPEQARPGLYQQMLPTLKQFGVDAPAAYDATTAPVIDQTAQALYKAYSGSGAGGTVQSQKVGEDGYIYNTFRDGRIVNTGVKADSRTQLRDQTGIAPSLVNLRTGVATPLNEGGQPPQQQMPGVYIDPSLPPEVQAQIRQAEAAGGQVPGQMFINQAGRSAGVAAARPDASQQITPYQQAQLAAEQRRIELQEQAAEDARSTREDAANSRRLAAEQKARQAQQAIDTRQAALNNVNRGIERVQKALKAVDDSLIGSGPAAQYATRYTEAGQELEAATGAMQNSMLALTRVPGVGSQSDLEARVANMIYPSLERDSRVNANTLANLQQFARDLAGTARQSDAEDRRAADESRAAAPPPRSSAPAKSGWSIQRID